MVEKELKEEILNLKFQEGRTVRSLSEEYNIPYHTISGWCTKYKKEAAENKEKAKQLAKIEEWSALKKEVEELRKENDFLKKAAAFFAKNQN